MYLTFDVELYMPLRTNPSFLRWQGKVWNQVLAVLRQAEVRVTCFTTGEFVEAYGDLFDQMVADGHEIASHTMTHRPFSHLTELEIEQELMESRVFLSDRSGSKVVGFRAPLGQVRKDHAEKLRLSGYEYDSSVAATHIPNHFQGLGSPKRPYRASLSAVTREDTSSPVWEIPVSVTRAVPIPCGGIWLSGLYWYHRLFPRLTMRNPHVAFLHPYDFMDLRRTPGAYRHDALKLTSNNWKLLNWYAHHWSGHDRTLATVWREHAHN